MDWNKQMEEMVSTWTDMQHRMWDNWMDAVKGFGGRAAPGSEQGQEDYRHNLEAWEKSVRQALEAQSAWTRRWSDKVTDKENAPEAVTKWAEQVQEMMKGWTEAQSQLWSAWFESVKTLDPSQLATNWDSETHQVLEAWQQAAQRAQDTLQDWAKMAKDLNEEQKPPK